MTWLVADAPWFLPTLRALHVALAVLLGVLVVRWWRTAPELRRWIGVAVGFAVAWLVLVPTTIFEPLLSARQLVVLQEGDVASLWAEIAGQRGHIGPGWSRVLQDLLPRGPLTPVRWMAFNAWFVPPLLALHLLAARALSGSGRVAVLLTAVLPATPSFRISVLSDQFAIAPSLALLAGVLPVALVGDPATPRGTRVVALLALAVAAPVLITYRVESAGLPLTALVGGLLAAGVPTSLRARVAARARAALAPASAKVLLVLLVGVWGALGWRAGTAWAPWNIPRLQAASWIVVALWPLNAAWTLLPAALAASLTLGVAGLALAGLARSLLHPLRTALVGVGLIVLFQAYWAAGHGLVPSRSEGVTVAWWELYRYLFNLHVVWSALAAWAWAPVAAALAARVGDRGALAILGVACLLPPLAGVPRWIGADPEDPTTTAPVTADVDQDPQRFYRWFVGLLDANPECAWITQTRRWGGSFASEEERIAWAILRPDPRLWRVVTTRPISEDPRAAVDAVAPGVPCAFFVVSPDCALVGAPRCLEVAETLPEVLPGMVGRHWPHRPFVHAQHGYVYGPEVGAVLYALPVAQP